MATPKRTTTLLFCFMLFAALQSFPAPDYDDSDEAWQTFLDLGIVNAVLLHYQERTAEPEMPMIWMPMDAFAKRLPNAFRSRLPSADGWKQEFMVGAVGDQLIVLSAGQNGFADAIEHFEAAEDYYAVITWEEMIGDDIVLVVGEDVVNKPRTVRDRQRVAMADLRSIGTAIESYSIDNNVYPRQVEGLLGLSSVEQLIEPIYIRTLPKQDPWGNDFLYWSDEKEYIIISMGSDGQLDRSYVVEAGGLEGMDFVGGFEDPRTDIIFANGQFTQWPLIKGVHW